MLPLSVKAATKLGFTITKNKYNSTACTVDGIRFDSKIEAQRWCELKIMERQGLIRDLQDHVKFPLKVFGTTIGFYEADFTYIDSTSGEPVTEDTKGFLTDLARWKLKHYQAQYGREVRLIYFKAKRRK